MTQKVLSRQRKKTKIFIQMLHNDEKELRFSGNDLKMIPISISSSNTRGICLSTINLVSERLSALECISNNSLVKLVKTDLGTEASYWHYFLDKLNPFLTSNLTKTSFCDESRVKFENRVSNFSV